MNTDERKQVELVVFTAKWCPQCPNFKKALADYIDKNTLGNVTVQHVSVDTAEGQQKAASLGVMALPTMLVYENGNPIPLGQIVGTFTSDKLLKLLRP